MSAILQMTRRLEKRPEVPSIAEICLRHFGGESDVTAWLDLRRRAFARQKLGVRDWNHADFRREFLDKNWWTTETMWLAEPSNSLSVPRELVGSVTLARRGEGTQAKPVIHWLMVLPSFRRRGLGRLLLATLEAAVWDVGGRQVSLETHSHWTEAVKLYESLGYEPATG